MPACMLHQCKSGASACSRAWARGACVCPRIPALKLISKCRRRITVYARRLSTLLQAQSQAIIMYVQP